MKPSLTIRPAVAADVDALLVFWRAAAEDTNRSDIVLGQQAWVAAGYERQPEWSRWVKFLPEDASELGSRL